MGWIPNWISNLMTEERARTRITDISPHCPAEIADVKIVKLLGDRAYQACVTYERARGKEIPSTRYCPTCEYNTDNLRRVMGKFLARRLPELLKR